MTEHRSFEIYDVCVASKSELIGETHLDWQFGGTPGSVHRTSTDSTIEWLTLIVVTCFWVTFTLQYTCEAATRSRVVDGQRNTIKYVLARVWSDSSSSDYDILKHVIFFDRKPRYTRVPEQNVILHSSRGLCFAVSEERWSILSVLEAIGSLLPTQVCDSRGCHRRPSARLGRHFVNSNSSQKGWWFTL
jgi:hypothetical protein